MGIFESEALEKLEIYLSKIPNSWQYRLKIYNIDEKRGQVRNNAIRFIKKYLSVKSKYSSHPSSLSLVALYVALNMGGIPMKELDLMMKVRGKGYLSTFYKTKSDAINKRKIIIETDGIYFFVEDEKKDAIQMKK
jgi:hypothetical protein